MSKLRLIKGPQEKELMPTQATPAQEPGPPSITRTRVLDPAALDQLNLSPDHGLESVTPGTKLGNYLIVSKIGEGGMGVVYKAHDTVLDRTVALKILSPHLFRSTEFLERFRIEAQAQAKLNGPNIVTLHSMFDIPSSLVLVMEYIEGHTLAQRIHNEGYLSVAAAVWVFEQALLGVDRAHRMGIVHRDLKPSNIFITATHEVKLMDFGVAKMINSDDSPTQVGSMIGSLRYISPEQINGEDADFRSDIYTLGISLYETVTGRVPFEKKTEYEYMDAHLHEPPRAPSMLKPSIPPELEAVILKAIEKDPNNRFQSAREFRNALLKLGIMHIRAYRRIKAHQRQVEESLLNTAEIPAPAVMPVRSFKWLTWSGVLAATGAAITLAALYLRPLVESPATATMATNAPAAIAVVANANSGVSAPLNAAVRSTETKGARKPASVAVADSSAKAAKNRASKDAQPKKAKSQASQYESLKKAWGG